MLAAFVVALQTESNQTYSGVSVRLMESKGLLPREIIMKAMMRLSIVQFRFMTRLVVHAVSIKEVNEHSKEPR